MLSTGASIWLSDSGGRLIDCGSEWRYAIVV